MIKLLLGDCIEKMKELEDNSIDSIVTDPPYELGFMGKSWDNTGIANNPVMWKEALRVLKPGGHLLAFSGTRTYHRMAVAIEDAGFEVRDMIEYIYGSGFPKSLNVFKQLKKHCTCGNMEVYEKRVQLQQTLGEAETEYEMRLMQEGNLPQAINLEKERGEVLQSGLSEQSSPAPVQQLPNNEGSRQPSLEGRSNAQENSRELSGNDLSEMSEGISTNGEKRRIHNATQISDGSTPEQAIGESGSSASYRPQSEEQQYREPCAFCKQWGTQATRTLGIGTALKPAHEPICMARKPLAEKTVAENVLKYGTGGINIDESRVGTEDNLNGGAYSNNREISTNKVYGEYKRIEEDYQQPQGRFPANLIHDNSEEVRECFPNESERFFKSIIYQAKASKSERNKGCEELEVKQTQGGGGGIGDYENDVNSMSGKYGSEKAPAHNNHPTVKPIALMEYLIKMVTPKGGTVLDPFMGSGSTGVAAKTGYNFIGIEMEAEYIKIAEARIGASADSLL